MGVIGRVYGNVASKKVRTRIRDVRICPRWVGASFLVFLFLLSGNFGAGNYAAQALAISQDETKPASTQQVPTTALPAGTIFYLRLETPVSTISSHLHAPVRAIIARQVPGRHKIAIPLGALVEGEIEKLIPSSTPTDRARVLLRFTKLDIPGEKSLKLTGHLKEVDNAREAVLANGTIQGILASETPVALLQRALAKLGITATSAKKMQEQTLGKADTSIDYPIGTDLEFVLDKPLEVQDQFAPTAASSLPKGVLSPVEDWLAHAPQRVKSQDGKPGDPLNLLFIGNRAEILTAFKEAGWKQPQLKTSRSIWETIRAVARDQGFGEAPVSQLYLFGRREDLAFEKMLNTFAKRHHIRLWQCPGVSADGREIWMGAATHDIGFDIRFETLSHAIDPDLDAERAKVGADLLLTGQVAVESLLTRPNPLTQGFTATGGQWNTDGKILAIELKPR